MDEGKLDPVNYNQKRVIRLKEIGKSLNEVSPSMCLAKWLQSTITLYNGYTHSCHHPSPHKITDEDLLNPTGIHNTATKIEAREQMLNGERPRECGYCWNIEDLGKDFISDRTYKSADNWAWPNLDVVLKSKLGENINPTYMEVAFDSTCNLKCTYCSPEVSSRWMEEIEHHGPYKLMNNYTMYDLNYSRQTKRIPIHKDDYNPYVEAFWNWWPELYPTLDTFRITGGEPLLSKHTWKVLEYVLEHPRDDLTIAINTNLCVPQKLIQKLVDYANKLQGKIKEFQIYTSCEASGEQAEFIRFGMDYGQFQENCKYVLENTPSAVRLSFMVTTNLLSAPSFMDFLDFIYNLRCTYNEEDSHNRTPMMIAYVRWPEFLNINNLTDDLKHKYAAEWTKYVTDRNRTNSHHKAGRFYLEEIDQVQRLCEFMMTENSNVILNRQNFVLYYQQYEKNRGLNVAEVFPELSDFIRQCELEFR
ncbi:hypothetical protein RsoM2USA_349 [Ralstonia phage RsoM2USA]|nr:hypothetical protein RsoM2USA_349 [Ralstonia phage RsoM2USA]